MILNIDVNVVNVSLIFPSSNFNSCLYRYGQILMKKDEVRTVREKSSASRKNQEDIQEIMKNLILR